MTISIKAKTPDQASDGWLNTGITVFHQDTEGVEGFAIAAGSHYRITKDEATRLGKYLLEIYPTITRS